MLLTGTKDARKLVTKISSGLVRNKGVTWFPELQDKSNCIIHLIWRCTYFYERVSNPTFTGP